MSNLEDRARTYSMKKTSHCKCFLLGWPKMGGKKPNEPFWPTVLLRQKKGENTQINH